MSPIGYPFSLAGRLAHPPFPRGSIGLRLPCLTASSSLLCSLIDAFDWEANCLGPSLDGRPEDTLTLPIYAALQRFAPAGTRRHGVARLCHHPGSSGCAEKPGWCRSLHWPVTKRRTSSTLH